MSAQSINSAIARVVNSAMRLVQGQARFQSHASVVCYLEGMPSYLRKDIGLLEDADIIEAVERGILRNRVNHDTRCDMTMVPHAT